MNPLRNNQMNMMQQFLQFKKMLSGKNPQDMLNQLMSSGRYTQDQLNWAKQQAEQFKNLLK